MAFLSDIFEYLNENCNYAVLRSYENLPQSYSSRDVDIMINESEYDSIKSAIYNIAQKNDYFLLQYYRDERFATLFFQSINDDSTDLVELDFFFKMSTKGILMVNSNEVLNRRQFNGKVYHVSLVDEVLDKCLCNAVLGVPYPEKYLSRYTLLSESEKNELNQKLQFVLGKKDINFENLNLFIGKKCLRLAVLNSFKNFGFFNSVWYQLRRLGYLFINLLKPKGIFLSFTGPDGSGKTTVLNIMKENYTKVFRGSIHINHFRPNIIPRIAVILHKLKFIDSVNEEYDKPHRGKPSGVFVSILRLLYYILDYIVGYIFCIRPKKFRRNIIIYDRYYSDIIIDSFRSNIGLSYKVINFFSFLIPKPRYGVLLTANTETVLKRKKELNKEEIDVINEKIEYISKFKNFKRFYNETTPNKTACEIMSWILKNQDKKLKKYLNK